MASRLTRVLGRQLRVVTSSAQSGRLAATQTRTFSSETEDDIVKQTFVNQQTQFRGFLKELSKVPIPLDPRDSKAVAAYAESLKSIRVSLGVPSATEKLADLLESAATDAKTVREFLEATKSIREELNIPDEVDADSALTSAVDEVEAKIGKPLTFGDEKGLGLWRKATESILEKLGVREEELAALEEKAELEIAKKDVEDFERLAQDTIHTYKRRDGLESVKVDLKDVDPRPYL